MPQFNTTELDFQKIKNNLIDYFKRQGGPFRDYDFTGSGLDHLLDILAYNTHYNAVTAHMAMNESFLDSAQVRGNVVSRAKLLGYTPKSVTAPSTQVRIVFQRKTSSGANTLRLPKGTQFTTYIDEVPYIFETVEDTVQQLDSAGGSQFIFNNVTLKQGTTRTENFAVDNSYDQRFILNSRKADTSTLQVEVFPTIAGEAGTQEKYELFSEFPNIDGESRIYFIDENSDGNFEIRFGNNLFGKRPQSSGLVRLSYLVSDGPFTNGARNFTYKPGQIEGVESNVTVTTLSVAAGGSPAEGIDSIKYNAPLSFIAQERAVTSDDYKSLIMKRFTGIDNVSAWGGETENVPQYGKIYISIKPTATAFLTAQQKTNILAYLNSKKVVGITPEIVDPEYTYIFFDLFYKYDPSSTAASVGGLSSTIKQTILDFNSRNLNNFDGVYRHSNLLAAIDRSNPAILNTTARVFVYKNVEVTANAQDSHKAEFDLQIDGAIDQSRSMIQTSNITIGGQSVQLADEYITGDNVKRRIYAYKFGTDGRVIRTNNNIGFLYPATGLVDLGNLQNDFTETIRITVRPASDDVISKTKKILQIDVNSTRITGDIDNVSIAGAAGLSKYNTINRDG